MLGVHAVPVAQRFVALLTLSHVFATASTVTLPPPSGGDPCAGSQKAASCSRLRKPESVFAASCTRDRPGDADGALLPGWEEAIAPDGQRYYAHRDNGWSSWDRPTARTATE